ncbi:manganese efflux pump MntP family protein [Rossellomorea vietnamensis]|uniref:manganese efflux pump MntP family protein n=1 Tax=Rossellomorea vietnamensis TaxID=218284 RepID=UPI001CCB51AE|nr:manganese efflux pump MntP family protein [Rossellomorea vietnamensis]MCA0147192.1 manganese efflux pump MntP family protein [Rossellomorea vietnamensis]
MNHKRIHDAIHHHLGEGRTFSKEEEAALLTKLESNHIHPPKRRWFPELLSLSFIGLAVLLVVGIIGSQTGILSFLGGGQPERLDTSLLKESEVHGLENMSEKQREEFLSRQPKDYYADTVENALKALPFSLTLPEKLPFDARFVVEDIKDWHFPSNKDGKDISVNFSADNGQQTILIEAVDFQQNVVEGEDGPEESREVVKLKQGREGDIKLDRNGGKITFENKNGVKIKIYFYDRLKDYNTRDVLTDLANQMVH